MMRAFFRTIAVLAIACAIPAGAAGAPATAARALQKLIRVPCARRSDCLLAVGAMMAALYVKQNPKKTGRPEKFSPDGIFADHAPRPGQADTSLNRSTR